MAYTVSNCISSRKAVSVTVILIIAIFFLLFHSSNNPISEDVSDTQTQLLGEIKKQSELIVSQNLEACKPTECEDCSNTHLRCDKNTKQRFPQAIIVGVRKGGTRALIDMLKSHPDIVAATGEVHYFDRDENFRLGVQWYIDQMPISTKKQITIEKSPSYFISEMAPKRMWMLSQKLKIMIIVRNPVDRTISDFTQLEYKSLMHSNDSTPRSTFEERVFKSQSGKVNEGYSPVYVSMYDIYFKRWLSYFDMKQIHVVDGDSLIHNPISELQRAEKFLGVNSYFNDEMFYFNNTKGFYCWKKNNRKGNDLPYCLGNAKGRKHPNISESTLTRLREFFRPHNDKLYSLINNQFNW